MAETSKLFRIAVDAMGGDHAPRAIVEGAVEAARAYDHEIILVGQTEAIERELTRIGKRPKNISIRHAGSVIGMEESASVSVRRKKDASVCICADMHKADEVDAIVTAGHTGAAVAATTLKLRLLEGIDRPGIGIAFPTLKGPSFLIDVGANIETKPLHYLQYAVMGDVYFKSILGKRNPTVGILNIGEEDSKGTEIIKEARKLLEKSRLNFIGNVEGRDIFNGKVDIIVCDGFVGNVVLKVAESIVEVIGQLLKKNLKKNYMTMAGAFLSKSAFKALKREVDYTEYGGAPLLGIDGICIISHGSSNPNAIKNAIRVAGEFVRCRINERIVQETAHLKEISA
jgi:glycerol-3-phosphate acyltransferase PlsX